MRLPLVALAVLASCSMACTKKQPPAAAATPAPGAAAGVATPAPGEATPSSSVLFEKVFFPLNRHDLTPEATRALAAGAKKLLANPALKIRVEGHADERGSTAYNLALSSRRAESIRRYLSDLGVESARIEVLALGEEKPLVVGHDESAWSRNRRGEMVVTGAGR